MNRLSLKVGAGVLAAGALAYGAVRGAGTVSAIANAAAVSRSPVFAEADASAVARVANDLHLTQDQRHRIAAVVRNERAAAAPDIHAIGEAVAAVQAMTVKGPATPAQVRAVAAPQEPAVEDAIVRVAHAKSEIYAVLTPEQRTRADALLASRDDTIAARIDALSGSSDRLIGAMAWRLDLTDDQQSRIRSIVDGNKPQVVGLLRTLNADRAQLQHATRGGAYDEAAVRALAADPARTAVELAADLASVKSQIYAVLTPEQRAKAEGLRAERRNHVLALLRSRASEQ